MNATECPLCGIEGWHACPGYRIAPMPQEKREELIQVMNEIFPAGAKENDHCEFQAKNI